jgi:peptidoglycan/xylan/chitin deacetylase (PgdA/CDA1 family)
MSSNEAGSTVMIELLSVGQNGYEIEVGLTASNGYNRRILHLDEYTYSQLNALGPFASDRVRLSLYPKWDPFRNIYYSTLIRMKPTFSETLYFACTDYYVTQLHQLKEEELGRSEEPEVLVASATTPSRRNRSEGRRAKASKARAKRRIGPAVLLCGIVCILLFLSPLRIDSALFIKNAEALDNSEITKPVEASFPPPVLPLVENLSSTDLDRPIPTPLPSEPPQEPKESQKPQESQEQPPLYEEVALAKGEFTYSLPKGYVALSFDDGPSKYTKQLVDILVEHEVAATFLFIGKNVVHHPDEASYAFKQGMPIGNHSWDHSKLTDNSDAVNKANLAKANLALEKITGAPVSLFRPPYGAINKKVSHKVAEQQMKVLMWNRDTEDWRKKNPEDLIQYFHKVDPSGAVFLLHEKKVTLEALPEIIKYLKAKDLKFVVFK